MILQRCFRLAKGNGEELNELLILELVESSIVLWEQQLEQKPQITAVTTHKGSDYIFFHRQRCI